MDFRTVQSILSKEQCTELIQRVEEIQFKEMKYYNKQTNKDEFNITIRNSSSVELMDANLLTLIRNSLQSKKIFEDNYKISSNLRIMKYRQT
jgi:hypothetical protein